MKIKITILFSLVLTSFCLNAQTRSIVDDLNTAKQGEGKIVIYQDEAISKLLGTNIVTTTFANVDNQMAANDLSTGTSSTSSNFVKARGYRIQVFSGNDQKRSKDEANSRKAAILAIYPNMDVTVSYSSPVWRVKAGNFKTQEQATNALKDMKDRFPTFGREMHVISDVVKIAVD